MDCPKIAIIIVNWNGWEDTIECLESLYQINYPKYEVILIDNNSEDVSVDKIKEYCLGEIEVKSQFFDYQADNKPIKIIEYTNLELESTTTHGMDKIQNVPNRILTLIENDKNYGFAKGNNVGIQYALNSSDSKYILLLNNDTVVDKEFLNEMVTVAECKDKIGFVGPKVYIYDKKAILQMAGGSKVDLKHGEVDEIGFHNLDNGEYDHYFEPDYVGGTCMLIKRELIEEIGLLDTNYYMYWEDADWCFRGRKYGYESGYSFKSKIWHKYGASSDTPFKMYYFTRNRLYFMKKNTTRKHFIQFALFLGAVTLYKSLYQLINQKDLKMSNSYLKGFIDGLRISYNSKNI